MNILVVDDQPSARAMLRRVIETLDADLVVQEFGDPVEALKWADEHPTDLVLLDYRMPEMDGIEFAQRFRRPPGNRDVPILLITVVGDDPVREAALEAGILEFLQKPVRPKELRARCRNLLGIRRQNSFVRDRAQALERQLSAEQREADWRDREAVFLLGKTLELRGGWLGAHAVRASRYAGLIALSAGYEEPEARELELAVSLQDVGMLGVPDALLLHPGPLGSAERARIEAHTTQGHDLLRDHHSRYLQSAARLALQHHERHDGSGYPQGLRGAGIPLASRIAAVADVLAALFAPRPHRGAWDESRILEWLRGQRDALADAATVDAALAAWPRLRDANATLATIFRFNEALH